MRLLSGHYLAQRCIKFHLCHPDLNFFLQEKPRTSAYRGGEWKKRGWEGVKGSSYL